MTILIHNARIWDADKGALFNGAVEVRGNRISAIHRGEVPASEGRDDIIDADGMTLMPGLVEGHCHPSFVGISTSAELGRINPESHTLRTAANVKLLLEHGFTSIFEAASAKPMIGVVIRDAINEGLIVGPRMRAASPEVTTTGGLGDERQRRIYEESFGMVADGVTGFRKVARECVRDNVDNMKINISGDEFVSHARSSLSVKMAVRNKVDCIYHCDFADEEALDMLESDKHTSFVGPAFGLVHNTTIEGDLYGMPRDVVEAMDLPRKFDACCEVYHEIRKRGIRVVVGGDYGFSITPMGQNARDIEHFVKYFDYTPNEALKCATIVGNQLMGTGDEGGEVKEGYLADLLLVDGDPLKDVAVLQKRENMRMIMKDGVIYKDPRKATRGQLGLIAVE